MNNEECENIAEQRNCCDNISNNSLRHEMLMQLKEYSFALDELNLYLDTHPTDSKALCLHNNYSRTLRDLENEYQKVYGPLTANCPCKKWRWIEEPWPWERGIM
jgi:spore coat protein JB